MSPLLIIGVILLIIGVILFFVQRQQRKTAANLHLARPAQAAELKQLARQIAAEMGAGSWQDYVKLTGVIRCEQPLQSELKQEDCVHYRMQVIHEYEETVTRTDSDGHQYQDTETESETIAQNQRSITFNLEDPTGQIEVDPRDANIETVQVLNQFQREQPVGGLLSFGKFSLALGTSFGNRRTLGYRYSESILPVNQRVFIVAMVSDQTGDTLLQKPNDPKQRFLISLKTEAELERTTARNAKIAFFSMCACLGIGIALVLTGLLA